MQRTTETLGGAGNVAANLAALNCRVTVIGVCGADSAAGSLRDLLSSKGVVDRLVVDPDRPTTTKTRIMAHKQQILRLDEERTVTMDDKVLDAIRDAMSEQLASCGAVILSDYGKGVFGGPGFARELIQACRSRGLPVLVDPKGTDWSRYRGASGITPNTAELEAVVGAELESDEKRLISSAGEIRARWDLEWLLVTRGPQGMCLIDADRDPLLIPAQAREVYDVSGAGDTVIATLAAALSVGIPLTEAARTANQAAGVVVGKLGTQPILASELSTALSYDGRQGFYPYSAAKMTDLEAALEKVEGWRATDCRVVFTNGCFDLLHPGHISLLYKSRSLGDRLVVGLNTDASIKRLKGSGRPILSEQDRAAMLGALECVDLVVPFEEDTPIELIKKIRPDILVKGSDYTPEEVVGKAAVESYGGCVKLVNLVEGYSTTRLTEKVMSGFQHRGRKPSDD
jgi:D-beta-D-heptose 7-phosphate kinase/D-beta-D-heptose 1-phosphate adenosyltransferase